MARQMDQEKSTKNSGKSDYSDELKKELEELHKFKWSHVLWPILSIIFISITLFLVYKNFIVKSNPVIDRQTPAEKIKTKPEITPEDVKKTDVKPKTVPKTEPKKAEVLTESYTIKDGDTLGDVAEAKGVGLSELLAANPGLVAEEIQIGQVIKIPKKQ